MLRQKGIDRLCCIVLAATLLLTFSFMGAAAAGFIGADTAMGYEERLFDSSYVHTIDLVMDDWEGFLATCTNEEYVSCTAVIDGERFANAAIRAKGNTSLSRVASYGNDRYSFKIEFDHYDPGRSYYGLDKLSLNNLIQDKTLMKDYLAYTLMARAGAAAPLCSFVQINVNGEPWGVYLAVEAVEDSFLTRNYGSDHGELYKPDSLSMGGGRGNGRDFDMEQFDWQGANEQTGERQEGAGRTFGEERMNRGDASGAERQDSGNPVGGFEARQGGGMGSGDIMLQYVDDDPSSYSNIFGNAKTDVTEADQARLIESLRKLSQGENLEEKLEAVDAEAVIRYLAAHHFMDNGDSYTGSMIHNYYLYEEDGRLTMLPWDYNLSFGAFTMGRSAGATSSVNSPIDSPVTSGDISSRPILSWIFESEEYTEMYHEVYRAFVEGLMDGDWLDQEILRITELLAPYVEQDENGFFTYEEFLTASETLREYCALRCRSIAGQLDGTVPSTAAAQAADAGALIDASHIDLNDLGEFNTGGEHGELSGMPQAGGGMFAQPDGFGFPGGMTPPGGMTGSGKTAQDGTEASGANGQTMPNGMTPPGGMTGSGKTAQDGTEASGANGQTMPNGMTPPGGMPGSGQTTQDGMEASGANGQTMPNGMTPPGGMPGSGKTAQDGTEASGANGLSDNVSRFGSSGIREAAEGSRSALLAVCTVFLLAALLFARFFKSGR